MGCASSNSQVYQNTSVQIRWLGHAGFRVSFADPRDLQTQRVVYFDPWLGGPTLPEDLKGKVPDDADLVIVSHGHFDHAGSAPEIIKNSKKTKAVCLSGGEVSAYFKKSHGLTEDQSIGLGKGGFVDFGFAVV